MKVLVAIKRVVDYNVKVHVLADNSGVDIAKAKMAMNPFDEIAVEQAVRLKEKKVADSVVVVSIGPDKSVETLRVALAMGADSAVHVKCDAELDSLAVSRILAKVCEKEQPDLIIMGKQAIDDDNAQVPQMLSAILDMPVATSINAIAVEGGKVTVTRETDNGSMIVSAELPAIVSADLRLAEPRYVTLPAKMKAKKKPVEEIDAASLGIECASQISTVKVVEPPARAAGVKLANVDALIDVLKNKAKVL